MGHASADPISAASPAKRNDTSQERKNNVRATHERRECWAVKNCSRIPGSLKYTRCPESGIEVAQETPVPKVTTIHGGQLLDTAGYCQFN